MYGQRQDNVTSVADGQSAEVRIDSARRQIITGDAGATPVPVSQSASVGGVAWTKTSVTLNGSSQQLLAANAARKGFVVFNPINNGQIDIDIAGGTVAANTGRSLLGGADYFFTGAFTPTNAITVIGTNGQSVTVWEAT